jgi:protein SEY1
MRSARETVLSEFETQAQRYHKDTFQRKFEELRATVDLRLHVLFRAQVTGLHVLCLRVFEEDVGKELKREAGFAKTVMVCKERGLGRFDEEAGTLVIEGTGWTYKHDRELLVQDIEGVTARLRRDEIIRLSEKLEKQVKSELEEPVSVAFAKPTDTIWDTLISEFETIKVAKVEAFKEKAVMGLNATEEDVTEGIEGLKTRAWMCLRDRLDGETEPTHLLLRLREQYSPSSFFLSPGLLMAVLRTNSGTTKKVFHESGSPPTTSTPSSNPPKNP